MLKRVLFPEKCDHFGAADSPELIRAEAMANLLGYGKAAQAEPGRGALA
jgi:acyl-CoA synthetase (NDP forming)